MSLLKIDRITKRFGGVTANENISFHVKEGRYSRSSDLTEPAKRPVLT